MGSPSRPFVSFCEQTLFASLRGTNTYLCISNLIRMQRYFYLFILVTPLLPGCVSQKKYNDLLSSKSRADREVARLTPIEREHQTLAGEMASVRSTLANTQRDLQDLRDRHDALKAAHTDLRVRYDTVLAGNQRLLEAASQEKADMTTQLSDYQKQLDEKARELRRLEDELYYKEQAIEDRELNIAELSGQLDQQRRAMQTLKSGLSDALRGFSASELTVVEKNGKIYVSMSQDLLFASGSNRVDQKGKDALGTLATVLNANPEIEILVEGHTDTDGTADFNWDLSVTRATAVTKELTRHGVDPRRITAAGRGFYYPVDTNETTEGKARNRRTEIILSPKLDQLFKLIN